MTYIEGMDCNLYRVVKIGRFIYGRISDEFMNIGRRFGYNGEALKMEFPYSVSHNPKTIDVKVNGKIDFQNSDSMYKKVMACGNYQKPVVISFSGANAEMDTSGFANLIRLMKDRNNKNLLLIVEEDNALQVKGARDLARLERLIAVYQAPKSVQVDRRVAA